ncbi:Leukotoxin [Nymphon striatum]|nr:Leukotoxin [Nymphon striatum]
MAMAMGVVVADASAQPDEESAPIAVDDAQLLRGGRLTWINVLHNDLYEGPQRPTVTIVDAPSEGRAAVYGKRYPSVFYRAPWRFSGIDTFTYELCVAGECSRATVTMVVGITGLHHLGHAARRCGDDVICGFAGSDQIDGLDLIFGSQGRDVINGGPGNDVIIGGWGKDILDGGPGDDRLEGGWASDQLFGGEGQDRLIGGWGADLLDGGPGVDVAQGGRGFDECSNAESWDRCEVIPEPVETGDFEVLAPLDGTDISAEIPIVVSYEPDVGIERIEVSVDGGSRRRPAGRSVHRSPFAGS